MILKLFRKTCLNSCNIYANEAIVIAHSSNSRINSGIRLEPVKSSLVKPPVQEAGRLASHHNSNKFFEDFINNVYFY